MKVKHKYSPRQGTIVDTLEGVNKLVKVLFDGCDYAVWLPVADLEEIEQ